MSFLPTAIHPGRDRCLNFLLKLRGIWYADIVIFILLLNLITFFFPLPPLRYCQEPTCYAHSVREVEISGSKCSLSSSARAYPSPAD